MKQLICSAAVLAAVLGSYACSSDTGGNSTGTTSSSGSSSSGSSSSGSSSGSGGGTPSITISDPTAGKMVTVTKPDDNVPVSFTTPNFMLAAAGTCPANLKSTNNCGHIHVGKEAPEVCPVCAHPQAYFQLRSKNY